jgi:hypothetical protein
LLDSAADARAPFRPAREPLVLVGPPARGWDSDGVWHTGLPEPIPMLSDRQADRRFNLQPVPLEEDRIRGANDTQLAEGIFVHKRECRSLADARHSDPPSTFRKRTTTSSYDARLVFN